MSWRAPGSGPATRDLIIRTIERLQSELGHAPSQQDVRAAIGFPRSTLRYHLAILEEEGKIEKLAGGRMVRAVPPTVHP